MNSRKTSETDLQNVEPIIIVCSGDRVFGLCGICRLKVMTVGESGLIITAQHYDASIQRRVTHESLLTWVDISKLREERTGAKYGDF